MTSSDQQTVNNKTGTSIAADVELYVDTTHHGGVTATAPGIGWTLPIGVSQATLNPTGAALLWG